MVINFNLTSSSNGFDCMFSCYASMEDFFLIWKCKLLPVFFTFIVASSSTSLIAQQEEYIITDRPDITESALVIPLNSFQLETGFVFQKEKYKEGETSIQSDNIIFFSSLFRYGFSENIELRFGGEYLSRKTTTSAENESEIQGMNGLFIGSKFQLFKNRDAINDLALLFEIQLPFGNAKLKPDKFEPALILSADKNIARNLELGVNIGFEYNSDIEKNYIVYSTSLGFDLNDRLGVFAEYFGNAVNKMNPRHNLDFGITYLQRKNIQIDASAGTLIFNNETDWFGSIGFSVRIGNSN